ncbi:hypothetical protein ACEQ73_000690 [Vibrio parahaemolyticus]|uniref:ORC-CDC6 family AAA ATPase n=1 Tax=Vibrio parahaemolyticus TaxID=670 RepID=UPI0004D33ECD|nr:hypothetical protein [Vibrio parahaemolyticus]EGQ8204776.1 hypothetical protein [Vibrio parahaemolyticus]EGQ8922217.1 hypothetical protein [Vibrio parahaemolyticus]EGR0273384.1 hypothetical protein [Vibrio parahaemolyticus]EGR2788613.1 hypothetical protein [Vibrio parahaemolyticus]EIK0809583.1 hypothetical protein [Vibrio parahaemolyticus]
MNGQEKQKLRCAFDSILRADYITLDNLNELGDLEEYFIDFFGILQSLLQRQDNFISGRRGTGKTTNLLRGYYECLKSIAPKLKDKDRLIHDGKVLPIYIDLSTCNDLFDSKNDLNLIEIHFIRQIISSLKKQLNLMFEEKFLAVFSQKNPALDDLDYIEKVLVEGITLSTSKQVNLTSNRKISENSEISAEMSVSNLKAMGKQSDSYELAQSKTVEQIKGLNVQEFLNKISDIKRKAEIDAIYVFVDEYSDLSLKAQNTFSALLKSFLGSRIGMFFKIGVITDRYDFGERIIVGRDIFPIPLDFNEYADRYNGAIAAISKTETFVERLILKRIESFCPTLKVTDVFKSNFKEIIYRITRETLGVSRTIGIILQNAFIQASSNSDGKIGLAEINYGISSARKTYQKQFNGSIKKRLVPGFNLDMWAAILEKAIEEKNKFPDRPASHFMADPLRKDYLNVLCENFLIHFISENVTSKHGGNYNLYSIDYDVCSEFNIKYADKKDEYTPIRFIYDSVLSQFDPYFLESKQKSYKCPECKKIYAEEEVKQAKVKRCFEDDSKLVEIVHQEAPVTNGNFAEVEIRVLGLISQLSLDEALTAREVADCVGCTRQKVSNWAGKVLGRKGEINVDKSSSPYKYYSSDA